MKTHPVDVGALLILGTLLMACAITGVPLSPPSVAVPSISVPTFQPPAIGLTLSVGAGGAGAPATQMPAAPAVVPADAIKWLIIGLVALVLVVLVIAAFGRLVRRTDRPGSDRPDGRDGPAQ